MAERPKTRGKATPFDIVALRKVWLVLSGLVILAGLYSLIARGLNFGVDFTGGALHQYLLPRPIPKAQTVEAINKTRRAVGPLGLAGAQITIAERKYLMVRTPLGSPEEMRDEPFKILRALRKEFGPGMKWLGTDSVGPIIGAELRKKGLTAFILGCLGIMLWVMIRYDFRFASCGILALIYDGLVVLGLFSLLWREVNSDFIAAILTILGYSINDSVVIFDRIRENMRLRPGDDFSKVTNDSLWQTMARSINTSLTTLFVVLALLLLGGPPVRNFCLALLIGIVSGTYSSLFLAAPLVAGWRKWAERKKRLPVAFPTPPKAKPKPSPVVPEELIEPTPEEVAPRRAGKEAPAFTKQVRLVVTAPKTTKPSKSKRKKKRKKRRH